MKPILKTSIEGPINEKVPFFEKPLGDHSEIHLDMEKVTFISSIGVRSWISWTLKIPSTTKLVLLNCPYVIVNQASMIKGFLPKGAVVESFNAYFACPDCSTEKIVLLKNGEHYHYGTGPLEERLNLPKDILCPKCSKFVEPDFVEEKAFGFMSNTGI